jgi:aminoglycoside phosphotransferase
VPTELAGLLEAARFEQTWVKPESEVWHVARPEGDAYLKIIDDRDLWAGEVDRLRWCTEHVGVPTPPVLGAALDHDGRGWVLTGEVAGIPSHDRRLLVPDAAPMIDAIGRGLRTFHDSTPPADCPFALTVDALLASAEARVARGGVDPATMQSPTYRRLSAERLLEHLISTRPDEPVADRVVTHGDPCQPNLLIDPAAPAGPTLCGMVDLGRVAVSDRYRDLAIVARSLLANLDGEAARRVFDAYGIEHPDPLRLEWYVLVDDMW